LLLNVSAFIGRFHPLLVHLPIGILLIAVVFQFLAWRQKSALFEKALNICLLLGSLSAVFSSVTGYLLSQSAAYDEDVVWWHQWLGITVAAVSVLWYLLQKKRPDSKLMVIAGGIIFCLLLITGHLGGTLTHGDDYLSFSDPVDDTSQVPIRKPLEDAQQARIYADIVQPVLASSCYSCHGQSKQKGKLRLDIPELIAKGGKNGKIINDSSATESELVKRLFLPESHKKHMPPKEKKQLTENELALLHWWVETGASFDKKVNEVAQTEKLKPILAELENPQQEKKIIPGIPVETVEKASEKALETLRKRGVVIVPVSSTSNYLTANFVSTENASDQDIKLLLPIKKQLVFLKAGETKITDSALRYISECTNLIKLHLEQTAISDKGIPMLTSLKKLQDLNLVGTIVTAEGILKLKGLDKLRNIYLFETKVNRSGWQELQKAFPSARLDSGGYVVPILEGDTSFIKPKKKKK